jgi:hypothetical protein
MSDREPGAINSLGPMRRLADESQPELVDGARELTATEYAVAYLAAATKLDLRATVPGCGRSSDEQRDAFASGLSEAGGSSICNEFVTDEPLATANAAERPEGRSTAFVQVSGCS